jgi:GNAT superfamily N-acetyltransferase
VPATRVELRDATPDDLPALVGLRESVGWGVQDWALRAVLDSPRGRFIVAADAAGEVVASGSAMVYGALGVVGNMVVAQEHRRQGLGAQILEAILEHLAAAGCVRQELYATVAGRPLYGRYGFTLIEPGSHVRLPRAAFERGPTEAEATAATLRRAGPDDLAALGAYDTPRFGGDRSELLARMLADAERPMSVAEVEGRIVGYAWLRPDGERIGPMLAEDATIAEALVRDAFRRAPLAAELTINLPTSNRPGMAWLAARGVEIDPWDGRMARGGDLRRRDDTIYASVVGALG